MQQKRRRRLPVRAGDARDLELPRRLAEEDVGGSRHRGASRGHDELRHLRFHRALDDEHGGAVRDRLGGQIVSVDVLAGHAEERGAGSDGTRVVGEVPHLDGVGAAEDRLRCERGDEALELHARERYRVAAASGVGVRRDLELDEAVAGDLGERGRGDDAAPDRAARLVDRDEHDEPRVLRRHDADERGHVTRARVAATLRLRRGPGLARDGVARHGGGRTRAALRRDDVTEHRHQLRRDGLREDALATLAARRVAADTIDQVRRAHDAAVRDRGIGGRHLNRSHADALADRHVADRRARPVARQQAARLAGRVDAGLLAEAEAVDPRLDATAAEHLRQRDRAHVRRLGEDLRDRHPLGRARLVLVDDPVGHLDRGRERERRRRRDELLREGGRDGHDLERRAGLVDVGDGPVAAAVG